MPVNQYPRVPYAMTIHDQKEIDAVVEVLKTLHKWVTKQEILKKKWQVFMAINLELELILVFFTFYCYGNI